MSWKAAGVCDTMRHLLQYRHGIPIFGWNQTVFLGGLHAFLARSSAACALCRGGGVGLRDDRRRCPRRARDELRQPRLADLLGAAVDGDIAGRAAHRAPHDAAGSPRPPVPPTPPRLPSPAPPPPTPRPPP